METGVLYSELKPLLFSVAYHMLGSVTEAEDLVHEAFLSLEETPSGHVRNVKAYLCRTVANRSINRLKSAANKREVYTGPWLPEPVRTGAAPTPGNDPLHRVVMKESLSTAYLLLLQQLSATERIVFLLREVFQYPFDEIADIVGKNANYCRQIFYRARKSLSAGKRETTVSPDAVEPALVGRFVDALLSGNVAGLVDILSADSVLYTDGGGKVKAAVRPIIGPDRIIRYLAAVHPEVPAGFTCRVGEMNGGLGVELKASDYTFAVITFQCKSGRISDVYIVMNPEKLAHFNN
ncbi:RNA polymerase sigma factor SigJ [Paenibacillus thermotolerans]|uniref:RNA polymerase sigma factor SigJ n=1 Tax=Paenibacillus thermotolerans TaxID=3027807 RepID=UPI0023684E97|nr:MULTISPECIES: RNA polymerase sigma factor SigJ [unclassified Paenibacillus]